MKVAVALVIAVLLAGAAGEAGPSLPRRGFLGLQFDLSDRSGPGLRVTTVVAGSTAANAGMRTGDRLTSVGGLDVVTSYPALRAEIDAMRSGDPVPLRWYRGSSLALRASPALVALPAERVPGSRVDYDAVLVDGAAWRLIVSEPARPANRLIFYLQGAGCESLDFWRDSEHPVKQLIDGWAARGYATARLEKRGVGDSDGPPCAELDEVVEHRGFLAALARVAARGYAGRVVLFGHGTGAPMAAALATNAVAAVIVYGAPTAATERIWRQVWQPVLVLYGSSDGMVSRADQENIARWTGGRLERLPGVGHDLRRYASPEAAAIGAGTGPFDPAIVEATLTWLQAISGG